MIELTKISGDKIIVNADEIEMAESSHDTTITLKSGKKLLVTESQNEIRNKTIAYKQKCYTKLFNISHEKDL